MEQILGNLGLLFEFPVVNLKIIIDGVMIGALFALAAYGLAMVWGVMNVKNLAQGDFVIAGGYIAWWLAGLGVPALLVMWVIGWVIYKLVITRVIERDLFTSLLFFFDGFVDIPIAKLIGVCMAAVLATCVIVFMKYSRMGQAIRATSQDARAARVLGIDTEKVYAFTFSLNAAICGAAGAIIVMVWVIQPFYGITYAIRAFVIVTAAGLGNLPGVIAAGLGIGALEQYGSHIFGIGYQQAIAVLLLLLVLVFRMIQQRRSRQVLK